MNTARVAVNGAQGPKITLPKPLVEILTVTTHYNNKISSSHSWVHGYSQITYPKCTSEYFLQRWGMFHLSLKTEIQEKQNTNSTHKCQHTKKQTRGSNQDGEQKDMELTPSHKYGKNTSTCGTTPTEHLLNTGRPQTSQKQETPQVLGQGKRKKEKQRQKNRDGTCTSGREL